MSVSAASTVVVAVTITLLLDLFWFVSEVDVFDFIWFVVPLQLGSRSEAKKPKNVTVLCQSGWLPHGCYVGVWQTDRVANCPYSEYLESNCHRARPGVALIVCWSSGNS